MKLAVVGGGSTYTPELIDGFARLRDALPLEELVLIDPAADRLELVGGLARRIFAKQGHPGTDHHHTDLDAGVDGRRRRAAPAARRRPGRPQPGRDAGRWSAAASARRPPAPAASPRRCAPSRSSSTSPNGYAARNPDAWIVDFTNPVGIVTRALLDAGHKAVGLCNVAIGFQRKFAALLGVAPTEVDLEHVGLNHLTWERGRARSTARTSLPELLAEHGDAIAEDLRMPRALLDRLGVVPSYYLRYYYAHDEVVRELRSKPSRAAEVAAMEKQLLEHVRRPGAGREAGAAGQARRGVLLGGGGGADRLAAAATRGDVQVVNTHNNGTLPFLPDDAVIEVPATVGATGAAPLPVRAAGAAVRRADRQRHGVRAPGAGGRAAAAAGTGSFERAARPPADRPVSTTRTGSPTS